METRPPRSLAKAKSLSAIQEVVINTESGSRTIGDLRRKVEADRERLASLDSASGAYRQVRRQITRNSAKLREQEARIKQRAGHVRDTRVVYIVMSGIFLVAGWGNWIALVVAGALLFLAWIVGHLPDHFYR